MQFSFPDGNAVRINCPDSASLLRQVRDNLSVGQGFALATINVDHLQRLGEEAPFRKAYAAQDLVCADGNPIVWLSRIAGKPVSLAPGSDLVLPLAQEAAAQGLPIGLIGSNDASLALAAKAMQARVPGLQVAMTHAPGFPFDPTGPEGAQIIDKIRASGARLCFLALGAPKQEIFAIRARDALGNVGFASIGAGLDFLSGHQKRAPKWARQIKMEWMWRMLSNPKRLAARYAKGFTILPAHAAAAWRQRQEPKRG
ncbi:WecB/TagA/CpsF family glycosyltransferase [Paracoccus shanxieyensis]|uniref:WecB/TagA/CpsF family glycosyltransferase n=1 Tax=Paracoccus shanxieyensis TaxID=2675752 RepID=A0A6L6IUD7_9RHOB|nr:WecB/TagA/CpsF family glycosyltransferase [Paracoccus shanxieyensis]MTH63231.1 WecB/TagA/CpsF family glycosyltransferase [Paracoccus shanxieyensis]MTH87145.1 WecB/TagA/CpsF family glycosyltransferase [Paracoccus shanxieyensis]